MTSYDDLDLDSQLAWLEKLETDKVISYAIKKGEVWIPGSKRDSKATTVDFEQQQQEAWGRNFKDNPDYLPGDKILAGLYGLVKLEAQIKSEGFTPFHTALEFVLHFMSTERVERTPQNTLTQTNDLGVKNPLSAPTFLVDLQVAGDNYNRSIPPGADGKGRMLPPLSTDMMCKAFDSWMKRQQREEVDQMQVRLRYSKLIANRLDRAVRELLACYWIEGEENVTMFKHLLWSLKRRMFNLSVPYDVFFSFYSREGGIGKSKLMKDLVPLPNLCVQADLGMLKDGNAYFALAQDRNLFIFDELRVPETQNGDQDKGLASFLALLKSIITGEDITIRRFNTQAAMTMVKNIVMVSTSNFPLYELICDETGMRRFWSFESKAPKGAGMLQRFKDAFLYIKGDGLYELYQMIDESDDEGYFHPSKPMFAEITAIQQSYARQDQMTRFLINKRIKLCDKGEERAEVINFTKFCNDFRAWRKTQGDHAPGSRTIETLVKSSQGFALLTNRRTGTDFYYVRPMTEAEFMEGTAK